MWRCPATNRNPTEVGRSAGIHIGVSFCSLNKRGGFTRFMTQRPSARDLIYSIVNLHEPPRR